MGKLEDLEKDLLSDQQTYEDEVRAKQERHKLVSAAFELNKGSTIDTKPQ